LGVANLTQFFIMTNGYQPEENERHLFQSNCDDLGGPNAATNHIPMADDDSSDEE
jgi:hypothetical protein